MPAGTWYAGVEGDDHTDCTYTITINKFDCPMNCSDRGTCLHAANGTRMCQCDEVCLCTSESWSHAVRLSPRGGNDS